MKKSILLIVFNFIIFIIIAQEDTDKLKVELLKNDPGLKKILSYPIEIIKAKSKNYYYVYIPGDETRQYYNSNPISENIAIGDATFNKGEINWFFVYDGNTKKIIAKDSNIIETGAFNGTGEFDEKKGFLIYDLGTSPFRYLVFYNLKKPLSKAIIINAFAGKINGNRGDYLISPDSRYIAYIFPLIKPEDEGSKQLETSLKIHDIVTDKDYEILPVTRYNEYEIVKWEKNYILIYDEYKDHGFYKHEQLINKGMRFEIK